MASFLFARFSIVAKLNVASALHQLLCLTKLVQH